MFVQFSNKTSYGVQLYKVACINISSALRFGMVVNTDDHVRRLLSCTVRVNKNTFFLHK